MIEKNAKALKVLSQAAEWEVPMIPNATDYVALTSEFQRYADELVKAAKQGNIDGADPGLYVKLTMELRSVATSTFGSQANDLSRTVASGRRVESGGEWRKPGENERSMSRSVASEEGGGRGAPCRE